MITVIRICRLKISPAKYDRKMRSRPFRAVLWQAHAVQISMDLRICETTNLRTQVLWIMFSQLKEILENQGWKK